ncbi:MAG TPA: phosphopentomutase [Solirubrobacteraceae bacterium]
MSRAFVVVMDAVGAGPLPDSASYGDPGADTLVHLAEMAGGLELPVLQRLGLGNLRPIAGVAPTERPEALHGRLRPLGPGKDSTTGHWELMGVITPHALPTFPDGFPDEVVARLREVTGHEYICNRPYSGTEVIEDFGAEHLRSGALILYTSQDSVLQIAAHGDVLSETELRDVCAAARAVTDVGRVIARPFTGVPGAFERTTGRKDFSVEPPSRSYLVALQEAGVPVHAVGKPADLFAGVGIDEPHPGATNAIALDSTARLLDDLDRGLVFTNLIETDQVYGHRKDVEGFHAALRGIDEAVGAWLGRLRDDDLLVLTADHGVDPASGHTDHTREHVPLLAVFAGHGGRRHDGPFSDVGATVLKWLTGGTDDELPGESFA